MTCAAAGFRPTTSRITRHNKQEAAKPFPSQVKLRTTNEFLAGGIMSPEDMRSLYDYNAWANRRAMEAASKLTTEQFVRPLGSSFGSVRDTLAHIYGAEFVWLERFQGNS